MDTVQQMFPAFLLVFCRITAFFVVAPVFSMRTFPATIRIGLAFIVSLIVFLTVGTDAAVAADALYVLAVIREIFAGLLIGFVAFMFFTLVQTAGAIIDMQVGFGIANIIDPVSGISVPLTGNLKYMVMIMVFLAMNGHHYLLAAIMDSYQWLPLDNKLFAIYYGGSVTEFLTRTFADTFLLAFQIAAPITVAMFVTELGLGLLARSAPQYNVFVIGIPLKIMVGLAMLVLLMPGLGTLFQMVFDRMFAALERLFGLMLAN